jgi:hypothetical protein
MASKRTPALLRIMQIEDKIKEINKDKKYRAIKKNIQTLKIYNISSIIIVSPPENLNRTVKLRRNSETAKSYLARYEKMVLEYDVQLKNLSTEREILQARLFKS